MIPTAFRMKQAFECCFKCFNFCFKYLITALWCMYGISKGKISDYAITSQLKRQAVDLKF